MAKCFDTLVAEAREAVSPVSAHEAARLHNRDGVIFVDPRPDAAETATGIIPGAHNIPLDTISNGDLPDGFSDRSVHVVTSCQSGPMGAMVAHAFQKLGFANVNFVGDGTQGWIDAGFPTNRSE